ncbi:MAG TPA: hypothetical protein PKW29_14265 [Clostridia bacterium]|jgi:hypothetical protein|nr:hypothetical protein [Clostridia bacterium]
MTYEQLHAAIASLPDEHAKRVYAHYFLGISKASVSGDSDEQLHQAPHGTVHQTPAIADAAEQHDTP